LFAQSDGPAFPPRGDDVIPSLGSFRIYVLPPFQPLFAGYPGYTPATGRLQSPTLSDRQTVVGRSNPHAHGSPADTGGTPVGTTGTIIRDSDFTHVPVGFQGPALTNEVHTQIRALNMADLGGSGARVRAGTFAPLQPISPGEVESLNSGGIGAQPDFPAQSFFDVFVEVDLPALGGLTAPAILFNQSPLLVVNTPLASFPPTVVYVHGNSTAVPIYFRNANPPQWNAGDLLGYLVLAGHGANFTPQMASQFQQFMASLPELPIYDNGSITTSAGGAPGGMDLSELDTRNLPIGNLNILGFGLNRTANISVADDITVCGTWSVTGIDVWAYQTGATMPTFTGVFLRIWNTDPRMGTNANVIWPPGGTGAFSPNIASNAGIHRANRVVIGNPLLTNRPVHAVRGTIPPSTPLTLNPGVYWFEWSVIGSLTSGPFTPPVSEIGRRDTGNAMQNNGTTWVVLDNTLAPAPFAGVALPIEVFGTAAGQTIATSVLYGVGKAGSVGVGTWDASGRRPQLGSDFLLKLVNGPVGQSPVIALGTQVNIPFPPIGTIYVNPITSFFIGPFDATNTSSLFLRLPHGDFLCGAILAMQGFWGDAGAPGFIGHSQGQRITFGN
jgi:hypothetical protein